MQIKKGLYVVFEYSMFSEKEERLGGTEPDQPIGFIVGDKHMLQACEKQLIGMTTGDKATIWLLPKEAFGEYDSTKRQHVPKSSFPAGVSLEPGMFFQAKSATGPVAFTIVSIEEDSLLIDLNHPLAGKRIRLEIEVHDVRQLTPEERQQLSDAHNPPIDPFIPPGMSGGPVKV